VQTDRVLDEIDINRARSVSLPSAIISPPVSVFRKTSAPTGRETDDILQKKAVVLLIEENLVIRKIFERQFIHHEDSGPFILKLAADAEEGIKIFLQDLPRIIFVDYELDSKTEGGNNIKKMNGKEGIIEIKRLYKAMFHKNFPGTFIGFSSKPEFNREMLLAGASHAIPKALDVPLLRKVLGIALNGS